MNRLILIIPILCALLYSCDQPDTEITFGEYRVTYKVNVERGLWFGNFIDGNGKSICVCEEPYQPDGWMHSYAMQDFPSELSITATSEYYADSSVVDKPDVTASIFLNGELLATSMFNGKTKAWIQPKFDFITESE